MCLSREKSFTVYRDFNHPCAQYDASCLANRALPLWNITRRERGDCICTNCACIFNFLLVLNLLCVRKQTSAIVEHHWRELLKATHPPFNFNSSQAPVTKLSSRENSAAPYKQRFSKHQNLHTMFTSMSATLSTSMAKGNLISKKL